MSDGSLTRDRCNYFGGEYTVEVGDGHVPRRRKGLRVLVGKGARPEREEVAANHRLKWNIHYHTGI